MPTNQQFLDAIVLSAKQLRRTPTQSEFFSRTRIPERSLFQLFPSWNAAVIAAGLPPHTGNVRVPDADLLKDWGQAVRLNRAVPSRRTYLHFGRYDHRTFARRFGVPWSSIAQTFRDFAADKPEWQDVLSLLPSPAQTRTSKPAPPPLAPRRHDSACHPAHKDRITYGNPISFRALRHEPVNEQGVVLLFGMLAEELGYQIESVQHGFPDCEAKRRIGQGRWQRVAIEFEFESRNFRDHGHSHTACDLIVCWRHNWPDCPEHLEILELAAVVGSFRS